jgi:hypothetical protein
MREAGHGFNLPPSHILTPYPLNDYNTFLGFPMSPPPPAQPGAAKKPQGVIWGKQASYFSGKAAALEAVAALAELHSVAPPEVPLPHGVVRHGHLARGEWHALLAESKFLLGLGA